jgi:hypothetical protein
VTDNVIELFDARAIADAYLRNSVWVGLERLHPDAITN